MSIKVLYYVDKNDNSKVSLIAFDAEKELRTKEVMDKIADVVKEANFSHCKAVAWEVVHNGSAKVNGFHNYEFGFEEIELIK